MSMADSNMQDKLLMDKFAKENIGPNKWKLTFAVSPSFFEEGMKYSYNKNKGSMNVPGFRKGKVPRKLLEAQYGKHVFYDDAINFVLQDAYDVARIESGLDIVSRPDIDVEDLSAETGVVFTAEVYTKPEVEIDGYRGLTYGKVDTEPSDEEISKVIDDAREKNARQITVDDRPVQTGDIVTLDYEGFMDGVPFEGGKGEDYELTIGSNTFIDTFEEQLVGANTGDSLEVNVTFPEDYHKADYSGKPATFKAQIKGIRVKELPEANDDFAQDVSEFESLDEYKNSIIAELKAKKEDEARVQREGQIMQQLVERAKMDLPEVMVENQMDQMVDELKMRLQRNGLPLDFYLQYMGQTEDGLREMQREPATAQVKVRLVLEKIAAIEGFAVTDEELDAELERMSSVYNMPVDRLRSVMRPGDLDGLKEDIRVKKASDLVMDAAVEL